MKTPLSNKTPLDNQQLNNRKIKMLKLLNLKKSARFKILLIYKEYKSPRKTKEGEIEVQVVDRLMETPKILPS